MFGWKHVSIHDIGENPLSGHYLPYDSEYELTRGGGGRRYIVRVVGGDCLFAARGRRRKIKNNNGHSVREIMNDDVDNNFQWPACNNSVVPRRKRIKTLLLLCFSFKRRQESEHTGCLCTCLLMYCMSICVPCHLNEFDRRPHSGRVLLFWSKMDAYRNQAMAISSLLFKIHVALLDLTFISGRVHEKISPFDRIRQQSTFNRFGRVD